MKQIFFLTKAVPRWVILVLDTVITFFTFSLSYFIIKQFEFSEILRGHFLIYTFSYTAISTLVFYAMRIHTGLIRYSNMHDMMRIFIAVLVTGITYPFAVYLLIERMFNISSMNVFGVLLINFFINSSALVFLRSFVRGILFYVKRFNVGNKEQILIYGSGNDAMLIKQAVESTTTNKFQIAGFIETNAAKVNSYIEQKKVFHINSLAALKRRKNITKMLLMNDQLNTTDKKVVIEKCLQVGIKVLTVSPSDQWVYGKLSLGQIQELKIEDLLQREPIVIATENIASELNGKCVLVTGAAGSIGSEVVRQLVGFKPRLIVLCDQAESALHEMQLEIEDKFPEACIKPFIGSIRDAKRMRLIFSEYQPDFVYHAAAYKHVPMMERHPHEAILTNVMGTRILADLAVEFKVKKFVMISTDKAVNPTNVMGASKRIAEMYVQSLGSRNSRKSLYYNFSSSADQRNSLLPITADGETKFITTRFGNVLGSNGSVIPRFKQQIQAGGPITVTHPEITRYFMTIPEAVQLVLEAGNMGKGSEIFVFDMGKPVKIVDLATKMIRLAGLTPDEDIKIFFTGLRPGEKLYEELLNKEEETLPTHHEKIKIARVIPNSPSIRREIEDLIDLAEIEDNYKVVAKMKYLLPEFKSNNSKYEHLDKKITEKEVIRMKMGN